MSDESKELPKGWPLIRPAENPPYTLEDNIQGPGDCLTDPRPTSPLSIKWEGRFTGPNDPIASNVEAKAMTHDGKVFLVIPLALDGLILGLSPLEAYDLGEALRASAYPLMTDGEKGIRKPRKGPGEGR